MERLFVEIPAATAADDARAAELGDWLSAAGISWRMHGAWTRAGVFRRARPVWHFEALAAPEQVDGMQIALEKVMIIGGAVYD